MGTQLVAGIICLAIGAVLALVVGTDALVYNLGQGEAKVYAAYAFALAGGVLIVRHLWQRRPAG